MRQVSLEDLNVVYLRDSHDTSFFHCSNDDLNNFLSEDAKNSQEDLISRTYLCLEPERILGFISLVTDTIEVKLVEKDDGIDGYPYPRYPAIKIARLAVDKRAEGRGIGRFLLLWAIGKTYQLSGEVGCRYITLDSKRESVGFYEKSGFKIIKKYSNRNYPPMYLNMYPIVKQMRQENADGHKSGLS